MLGEREFNTSGAYRCGCVLVGSYAVVGMILNFIINGLTSGFVVSIFAIQ